MGGVLTDARGRSTIDGLWACGEVTSTGAHGANRLASNSLLEAVVFGARIAEDIAETLQEAVGDETPKFGSPAPSTTAEELEASPAMQKLRLTMTAEVGVIRDASSLASALRTIGTLEQETKGHRRLANMLTTAKLIAAAAYARQESRGAHFRSDYPKARPELASRSALTLAEAEAIADEAASHHTPANRAALQA
jgi:L-aspartate oxidase